MKYCKIYAALLLDSLSKVDTQAIERSGFENIWSMAESVMVFDNVLNKAMEENT